MMTCLGSPRLAVGAALAISSLLLSGCGGSNTDAGKSDQSSTPSVSASGQTSASSQPSGSTSAASPDADLGNPAATRTTSSGGFELQLKIYPVQRSGDLATLNFTITVAKGPDGNFQVASLLTDGDDGSGDTESIDTVDGVKMLDPGNKKVYLVASDGSGHCLCTRDTGSVFLKMGETSTFSTTYAAPPSDVTSVSLVFPAFGTITGVPVQ